MSIVCGGSGREERGSRCGSIAKKRFLCRLSVKVERWAGSLRGCGCVAEQTACFGRWCLFFLLWSLIKDAAAKTGGLSCSAKGVLSWSGRTPLGLLGPKEALTRRWWSSGRRRYSVKQIASTRHSRCRASTKKRNRRTRSGRFCWLIRRHSGIAEQTA